MVPASPGGAVRPEHALEAEWAHLLARRLRGASMIALVALAVFGVVDGFGVRGSHPATLPVKLLQVAILATTLRWLRHPRTWRQTANIALAFVGGLMLTADLAAVLRQDLRSLAIFAAIVPVLAATLVPWGVVRQAALCAIMLGGYVAATAATGAPIFPYPGLAVLVGHATSVYVAAEVARHALARLHAEAALRESESRFRQLAEDAPVMIWMTDSAHGGIYLNAAWTGFFGTCEPQAVATRMEEQLHPDDRPRAAAIRSGPLRRHEPWEIEARLRDQAGEYRWLRVCGEPRRQPGGALAGWIGTATDVTERRLEAEALAAARNAALEAARLKSDFLATMSHEIRTPMHGIFGMTELALDTADESERREFLLRARACAKTLMTLLDEILDFSRLEAGRTELLSVPFDLREVVYAAVDTVAVTAARKGLELVVDLHPALPERLLGDATRLRQILTNLLGNAVKFTSRGEVVLTVEPGPAAEQPPGICCAVRDTGIGVDPGKVESIFEAFTQGDHRVGREYGGTGLGLAITHRLVTLMAGRIAVRSLPGHGSTFEVWVPLDTTGDARPPAPRIAPLHRVRLLLVDDNATCRRVTAAALRNAGATVFEAESGESALAAVGGAGSFDAALIDTDLPGDDGLEVARRLRRATGGAPMPFVFLVPLETPAQAPVDLQPAQFARKPPRPDELVHILVQSLAAPPSGGTLVASR